MHIENAYRIIPVYTADVSGVCSALFELGGMVVMHDPSGCNSTYNTHDETRWYEMDSQIFITGLTEVDAVMGNDRKLVDDVIDAANRLHPKFVALCGSPVPFLNGTDFKALARIIERETQIPSFAVETNGMHDYVQGAGTALRKLAERFVGTSDWSQEDSGQMQGISEQTEKHLHRINILGMTPLDYAYKDAVKSMRNVLGKEGFEVQSIWAMGDSLENMQKAGAASVNLVVSQVGLETAKYFEQEFQIPYVAGVPIGPFREQVAAALRQTEEDGKSRILCRERAHTSETQITLIGEPVTMGSLAAAITMKCGCDVQVISPMENCEKLLAERDLNLRSEEAIEQALKDKKYIVADPLYLPICPEESRFYELPHAAFSGRCYLKTMPDLLRIFEKEEESWD